MILNARYPCNLGINVENERKTSRNNGELFLDNRISELVEILSTYRVNIFIKCL